MNVGIVGASGYGGAELLRLLAHHPTLKVRTVAAGSQAGQRVEEVFPHLDGLPGADAVLAPSEPDALEGCDLVFLATPHAVSMELAPPLADAGATVVDLSGAFRLEAGAFERWYGLDHTAPDRTPAAYGLPELFRSSLPGASLIAGPGCYPTASLLALAPLAGLIDPATVHVVGMSGTSGAGKGLRDDLHASHAFGNVTAYGAPTHRHTPEIERWWSTFAGLDEQPPITFVPHLVPTARGMLCTVTASLVDVATDVRAAFLDLYGGEQFVRVRDGWPSTTHLVGGNGAHVGVAADGRTGRVTAMCALDNLVKGAAGQALQAANVALGFDESAGLSPVGMYP
jgi:N-acetyl-gamma-glutamyl-phosphate reductase